MSSPSDMSSYRQSEALVECHGDLGLVERRILEALGRTGKEVLSASGRAETEWGVN